MVCEFCNDMDFFHVARVMEIRFSVARPDSFRSWLIELVNFSKNGRFSLVLVNLRH